MKKIIKIIPNLKIIFLVMLFQVSVPVSGLTEEKDNTELSVFAEIDFEYTDNVFRLTHDQISTMNENDPDDILSGRYNEMDSLSDYIFTPRIGIKWGSDSPFGGKLRLTSWLRYNFYLKNDDSGFPEGRITLKNSIGEKGSLSFEGNFIYGYKKKNYLSSIDDTNGNGNISKDERTYSAAIYDEYEGIIGYRHEFIKDKDKRLSELHIRPFAGYSTRTYNSSFKNRDRDNVFGGVEVQFEFINKIDLDITYLCESVSSPGNVELVLFDETVSGIDVNDDGSIKRNAPLYTGIDRSSDRYTFKIDPSIRLTKDIKLYLGYSKRTSEYTSNNSLDIEHYNQKAYRKKYKSGISYDFLKSWSIEAEYCKTEDQDPEDGMYKENSYLFTLKYKF